MNASPPVMNIYIFMSKKQPPETFYKKSVLKNFGKFTEKHMCHSLFINNVAGWRLRHRYFPVNFAKSFRIPFYKTPPAKHLRWLLLIRPQSV